LSPSPLASVLVTVACAILLASLFAWSIVAIKTALTLRWIRPPLADRLEQWLLSLGLKSRLPLVPWTERRPVPWSFVDLLSVLVVWMIATAAVIGVIQSLGSLKLDGSELTLAQREVLILANGGISFLVLVFGLSLITVRAGATAADFGWSGQSFFADLRLGLIGFVLLAPPTYALQGLLVYLWKPSEHPLIEMFKEAPEPKFFGLLFISAAVVAPLFEELLFRVLQQGFLEKWFSFDYSLHEMFLGTQPPPVVAVPENSPSESNSQAEPIEHPEVVPLTPVNDLNPYASPAELTAQVTAMERPSQHQRELKGVFAWLPICISSAIFALLHYSHGPDWVPLFFLAMGMGYLYQRTHRLLPSLVVHGLLNSLSMCGLWVQVKEGIGAAG